MLDNLEVVKPVAEEGFLIMNDTKFQKAGNIKKIFAYTILAVMLGSGICYAFYRMDKEKKVKRDDINAYRNGIAAIKQWQL